jgi:hypothetical protein
MILLAVSVASARPTDGGLFSFTDEDVVTSYDGPAGTARVWYSTSGPNVADLTDDDGDGVPDFVAMIADRTEDVLAFYAQAGFRPPLSDGTRGGSDAMDVYLVDFAGSSDGNYAAETCSGSPRTCSGYFVMENDFHGYGYSDLDTAVKVLTSHELFHAVQAAYDNEDEVWFSEGTAVWAEDFYDEGNEDFVRFCSAYLEDTGRSLNEPPAGPVPTFAYATAIWWWYLTSAHGDAFMLDLMDATAETTDPDELLARMSVLEEQYGGTLHDDFSTFAAWNLATGFRSGQVDSYPFADQLEGIRAEASDDPIVDDNRFYPLATTYYKLEHPGGHVWFAMEADSPSLAFSLWSSADNDITGKIADIPAVAAPVDLGDLPAGDYWLVGSNPTLDANSTKVQICLGSEEDMAACAVADTDTGDTADAPADDTKDEPGGCGCATGGTGAMPGVLLLAALIAGRRLRRG